MWPHIHDEKMTKEKPKKTLKVEITDVLFALGGSAIALFAFNYFQPPIENMFSAIIFILILILVKQK